MRFPSPIPPYNEPLMENLASSLTKFQQQAVDILRSDKINKAFQLDDEPKSHFESYGRSPLGRAALAARRLIQAGRGL